MARLSERELQSSGYTAQSKYSFNLPSQGLPGRLRFFEPDFPRTQDSEPLHQPSGGDTGSSNAGGGGGMPDAWLEWSEAEDEGQESRSEKFRATEEWRWVVQILGQLAAGWAKAGSLLGGGKVPLSENTEAVGPGGRDSKIGSESCG